MKQLKNAKALLLIGMVLLMAACTAAWQRGRNAEQATEQATNTTKSLLDGSRKTGKNDSLQLKDIIFPKSSSINDLDRIYYFDTSKSNNVLHFERTEIFFETYRHFFAIPDDFTFQYVIPKYEWNKNNNPNINYKVYYKGISINVWARVELFENNNSVRSVHLSFPFSPSEDFDIQPTITEPQAFELMLKACYPARYVWEEEYQEPVKKLWKKDSTFRFEPPKGKLIINGTKLQYHYYVITCHNYIEAWNVFIDAKTGEAKVYDNAQYCHEVCDMGTSYSSVTLPTLHDYGNASLSLNSCSVNNCTYIHYKQVSPYVDVNYLYKINPTATETIVDATYLSSGNCEPATVNVSATTATITDQGQTTAISMPLDSLILKKEDNGHGYTSIYFDTTKLKYFPDLDPVSLVTLPKYKALFGLTDDYSLVKDSVAEIGRKRIAYKNIPYKGSSYSYDEIGNKLMRARICKFIPKYEPEDIKISMDSAIQIILKEDYPSRKQYYKKRLLDSLGYIPEKYVKLLHEEPLPSYTLDRLRPDAKFGWDTKIPLEKAAFLKYIEADLAYTEALTEVTPLCYTFVVHTLRETWIVYVDAITGQLYKMRDDHY